LETFLRSRKEGMGIVIQPVLWKMRLAMIVEMQIEILNGGEILVQNFWVFLCNITKITQNECFPGLLGKYAAAGNRLIDFDL